MNWAKYFYVLVLICNPVFSATTEILHSWYSPSRGDNFATTHPIWIGGPGEKRSPDYAFNREEAVIFSASAPQPPDTVPLYSWYSPSRGDNFITTHPTWAGKPGDFRSPDYRFVRVEGYVYRKPFAGTVPLYSWYSPSRGDNFMTTHPVWIGTTGESRSPDYRYVRLEGYALPIKDDAKSFGYGAQTTKGTRPLLVALVEFSDFRLTNDTSHFEELIFGPKHPNLASFFLDVSRNQFGWEKADIIKVRFSSGVKEAQVDFDARVLKLLETQGGFDFSKYDVNGDKRLTKDELGILVINANYSSDVIAGGQTRGIRDVRLSGVVTRALEGSFCDEFGDINLFAHELFHQLGFPQHIYGPGASLNQKASFFAASYEAPGPGPIQLDPWHKMRAGWLRPRVFRISDPSVATYLRSAHSHKDRAKDPIILYDPKRGEREFFILEYRTPKAGLGYDKGVLGQGLAVWYVQTGSDGALLAFDWPPPITEGVKNGDMFANYLLGPNEPGFEPFWSEDYGEFSLYWGDNTDSGLKLRVGPVSPVSTVAWVQWRKAGEPFLSRVDKVTPTSLRTPARITIDGMFTPMQEEIAVVLKNGTGFYPLEVQSIAPQRIIADVASEIPRGSYRLTVGPEGSDTLSSNAVLVTINSRF